jgi:RNA polymerase sigma-70 factor (ECF subfamily)
MITSGYVDRLSEILPMGFRLIRRARTGDTNAFATLCEPHIDHIYRYVHFLVPNSRIAEGLTYRIFFKAWEQFENYNIFNSSFKMWLYAIAHDHIIAHCRTHKTGARPDSVVKVISLGGEFREDFQLIRDAIHALKPDSQHYLILKFIVGLSDSGIARLLHKTGAEIRSLQMQSLSALAVALEQKEPGVVSMDVRPSLVDSLKRIERRASSLKECLDRHPKQAARLRPLLEAVLLLQLGRDVQPLPAFMEYTHDALLQYLQAHIQATPMRFVPALRRAGMALIILAVALMSSGTAYAQSVMPDNPFYGWKRASENIWLALSPNSVTTQIMFAERRFQEWVAVADDPELSVAAIQEYEDAIAALKAVADEENLDVILSALKAQQVTLLTAGLYSPELSVYLAHISTPPLLPPSDATPVATPAAAKPVISAPTNDSAVIPDIECPPNCGTGIGNSAIHGGTSDNKGIDGNSGIGNDDNVQGADGNNGSGNDDKVQGEDGNSGSGNDDKDKGEDGNNGGGNDDNGDPGGGKKDK